MRKGFRGMALALVGLALIVGGVAALGVFGRGDGTTALVESVRGERYAMATTGLYAFNAERVVAEGIGWDLFTLLAVVPAMLVAAPLVGRGSLRARLFALGLLAYLFYQYLMYAMTWALGPLFLPFVAVFAASLWTLVWVGASVAREPLLASRFDARFPRRGVAALAFVMGVVLTMMWLARVAAGLRGALSDAMLLGQTTMVVQALDLGLIVPLCVFVGVTVLRRSAAGYVLASVLVVKAVAMASAICAMVLMAARVEGKLSAGGLAFFAAAALCALALGVRAFQATHDDGSVATRADETPPRVAHA